MLVGYVFCGSLDAAAYSQRLGSSCIDLPPCRCTSSTASSNNFFKQRRTLDDECSMLVSQGETDD